ncbi:hypothetical protein OSTOST_14917 [Ostertagia ostertagi]
MITDYVMEEMEGTKKERIFTGIAADRARDIAEPVAYDVKEKYVTTANSQSEPLSGMEKDMKNNIVELYLGISVLMLGISSGRARRRVCFPCSSGKNIRPFDRSACLVSCAYLRLPEYKKKTLQLTAMDNERRHMAYSRLLLIIGILLGHLIGGALTSVAPSVFFIPPLILSLLMDQRAPHTPLADMERNNFFAVGGAMSSLLCTMLAILPVGRFSMAIFLLSLLHVAFLTIHFQVVTQCAKEKIMMVGESQFSYIMGILVIQTTADTLHRKTPP